VTSLGLVWLLWCWGRAVGHLDEPVRPMVVAPFTTEAECQQRWLESGGTVIYKWPDGWYGCWCEPRRES